MPKISQLPQQSSPTTADKVPIVSGGVADFALLSDLIILFNNNIPAGAHSDVTRGSENFFPYVQGGSSIGGTATGKWTADSAGVNRNASMSAATVYLNGRRIPISAVTARTFTASKDTYVDVLDNLDGTGTLVYTEVTNNAASPALAANSIRIAIIVTGATTIAAAASINQGQEDRLLPIASSIPYSVSDSLGNLICPRDPLHRQLSYRRILSTITTSATTAAQATGLSATALVPDGHKVKVIAYASSIYTGTNGIISHLTIWDGTVGSGTQLQDALTGGPAIFAQHAPTVEGADTPTTPSKTYNAGFHAASAATTTMEAAATRPAYIKVLLDS